MSDKLLCKIQLYLYWIDKRFNKFTLFAKLGNKIQDFRTRYTIKESEGK